MLASPPPPECPISVLRWQEDCRPSSQSEAPPDGRTEQGIGDRPIEVAPQRAPDARSGWQNLRFVPLTRDSGLWLQFGAEYRARIESIDRPTYGVTPAPGFTSFDQRFLVHADLRHDSGARAFVQLAAAASTRRAQRRTFDRSAPDLQQAFVDVPLGNATLRLGRQEFDGDGSRLFAIRDAGNLRRAFDMAQLDWRRGGDRVAVFYGSPVLNSSGAFDDRRTRGETFGGAIVRRSWRLGDARGTLAVAGVERRRSFALFQDSSGRENRRTALMRATVDAPRYSGNLTLGLQRGRTGQAIIRAWGGSGEAFWKTEVGGTPVRVGASFGYASGDGQPDDGLLGTFDPIYPNLGYFTDAPIVFPGNSWDIYPQASARVTPALEAALGIDFVSRVTNADATYQSGMPRLPLRTDGKFLGALPTVKLGWTPSPHAVFSAAVVHAIPGQFVKQAGGRSVTFGTAQITVRY